MKINEKEIEQASKDIDLSGFKMQDNLNPKIWDKDQKMKSEVKKNLLKIADDYFESLELPGVDIEDVTMTGSLANYNWSKYSDVDLHIVVDYDDLPMERDLVQDFLKSKSSAWNKEHDVTIYGYDVELYVQDINEPHHSTGVYSVLNNEWNIKPEKKKISIDDKSVKDKANLLMDRIEDIYDEMDEVENETTVKRVDKLTDKIKKMRQSGLDKGGEFSVENMVFKVLRRNGMLDRLYDIKTVAYDKSVTLESINESDFDWTENLPDILSHNEDWILVNDVNPSSIEEGIEMQEFLFKLGYKWNAGELKHNKIYMMFHYNKKHSENELLYLEYKGKEIGLGNEYLDPNNTMYQYRKFPKIYYWSKVKPNRITESNDFDWAKDIPITYIHIANDMYRKSEGAFPFDSEKMSFSTYVTKEYGVDDKDIIHKVWRKYRFLMGWDRKDLSESNDFDWTKDIKPIVSVGDVFHTRTDFTPKDLNAEVTFEIVDISPDGKWVRFAHHKGSMDRGTYIDIDRINKHTMSMGWDRYGYNGANSTDINQVLKNINTGFWKRVNVPGYLQRNPEEYDRLIKLGSNINESNDFDWAKDIQPEPETPEDKIHVGAVYRVNPNRNIPSIDMLLKVYKVDRDVHYEIIVSNDEDELIGEKSYVRYNEAVGLLKPKKTYVHNGDGSMTEKELEPYWLYLPYHSEHITESNDFDWITDIPAKSPYRYFEIYACWNSFYDEETGEDECTDGGSYFVKIPEHVVDEIWDYTAEDQYYAGPGDEGEDVIEWCIENNLINGDDVDMFDYVTELSETDYCNSWGKWNPNDEGLCWSSVNESNEFDWINDIDDSKPQKGTAWAITGIKNETDSIQCQEFLFNLGFEWGLGKIINNNSKYIRRISSIWEDDIRKHRITYGSNLSSDFDKLIQRTKEKSNQNKLYHYEWVNGETKLKDIIYLTDNINESNDFDWTRDIQVTPIDNGPICEALYGEVVRYFRNKQPISYGDYYYSMDGYSGTIVWGFNDTDEYVVYATPYWEGECELNIDIQGDMGDYETLDYIELPKFEYVEALHQWLENEYPKIVVKRIKDLGPLPE